MPLKPDASNWMIKEQIIEDPVTGLTFQFEMVPGDSLEPCRLRIFGDILPYGNREIFFSRDGEESGAGTFVSGLCKPTWVTKVDDIIDSRDVLEPPPE